MTYLAMIESEEWEGLWKMSPLNERIEMIDRALLDPRTTEAETIAMRHERLGMLTVRYYAEEMAMREMQPQETDAEREDRELKSLEKKLGYRPLWSPRRKPQPARDLKSSRFRRGA